MIDELPWLAEPWRQVSAALRSERFPQGLLILGNRGLGCTRLARAVAAARLCEQPGSDGQACGTCASCRRIAVGSHPDFIEIGLLEDKTRIIVDQIRELSRALSLASGSRGLRCALIHPAELMNLAASNALLKTLEEAPRGVSIIMVSERLAALPVTIASRSLKLPVSVPDEALALEWLRARSSRDDWPLLLGLAAGAPLETLILAEQWPGSAGDDIRLLGEAAAGKADPVAVAVRLKGLPLDRMAAAVAWFAHGTLKRQFSPAMGAEGAAIENAARNADPRAMHRVWHSARELAINPTSLNAELARERLILLLVNALHRPSARSI